MLYLDAKNVDWYWAADRCLKSIYINKKENEKIIMVQDNSSGFDCDAIQVSGSSLCDMPKEDYLKIQPTARKELTRLSILKNKFWGDGRYIMLDTDMIMLKNCSELFINKPGYWFAPNKNITWDNPRWQPNWDIALANHFGLTLDVRVNNADFYFNASPMVASEPFNNLDEIINDYVNLYIKQEEHVNAMTKHDKAQAALNYIYTKYAKINYLHPGYMLNPLDNEHQYGIGLGKIRHFNAHYMNEIMIPKFPGL